MGRTRSSDTPAAPPAKASGTAKRAAATPAPTKTPATKGKAPPGRKAK